MPEMDERLKLSSSETDEQTELRAALGTYMVLLISYHMGCGTPQSDVEDARLRLGHACNGGTETFLLPGTIKVTVEDYGA